MSEISDEDNVRIKQPLVRIKCCLLLLFCFSLFIPCSGKKKEPFKYDIECAGSGVQGSYLVKVSVYLKKGKIADDLIKEAAVHGVIFRGFSGIGGCTSQQPLSKSPTAETEHNEFFTAFFDDNGQYLNYANIVNGSFVTLKTASGENKISAVVSVQKDMLRKDLESAGVVKGLSSGF